MNKIKNILIVIFSLVILFGCASNFPNNNLPSIEIDYSSVKLEYSIGEDLDLSGFKVYIKNSNEERIELDTADYQINSSEFDNSKPGIYKISVTYLQVTAYFNVKVLDININDIETIRIVESSYRSDYYISEEFYDEGLVFELIYLDGTIKTMDSMKYELDSSCYEKYIPGVYTINVDIEILGKHFNLNYDVNVNDINKEDIFEIKIDDSSVKIDYYYDEPLEDDIIFIITLVDGVEIYHDMLDYQIDYSNVDINTEGCYKVIVNLYEFDKEYSFEYFININKTLKYPDGIELNMAVVHNSAATSISFLDSTKIGKGLTLADGHTYQTGDLKPVWAELENILGVNFNDVYSGASHLNNEFYYWKEQSFNGVDVLVGNATLFNEEGKLGNMVNLSDWINLMPNFKKFLKDNPIVELSILNSVENGEIYYIPYFDGFNDIEKHYLMRIDWLQTLLDGEGDFTASASDTVGAIIGNIAYQPYMPTSGTLAIESLTADGTAKQTITKNWNTNYGNIIDYMNKHVTASTSGVELVNMLRHYIDNAYNGYYGNKRSDLFAGYNACWDADELVALLRCVVTNTQALTGQNEDKVTGIFPREVALNRTSDLFSLVSLFGVRGYESRNDYLYFDANGKVVDARGEEDYVAGINKLNELYQEGLILQNFDTYEGTINKDMYQKNRGFMLYDYVQTQCLYNNDAKTLEICPDFYLSPVMTPVAKWYDGSNAEGTYMRFTESWRSAKTTGWGIPSTCTGDKLKAALFMFDYMFSEEGANLMSYGPDAWRSGETINYNGEQIPELSEAALDELWNLASGNYTNYARYYLGSTLPVGFVKDQGMEYQYTTKKGQTGIFKISTAIEQGIIKHLSHEIKENLWYTAVPTSLNLSNKDNEILGVYEVIGTNGLYSKTRGKYNIYVEIIKYGFGSKAVLNNQYIFTMPESSLDLINYHEQHGGSVYLVIVENNWQELLECYNSKE